MHHLARFWATALLSLAAVSSQAETRVWNGAGGNDLWSTDANWVGNQAPGEGDDVVLPDNAVGSSLIDCSAPLGALIVTNTTGIVTVRVEAAAAMEFTGPWTIGVNGTESAPVHSCLVVSGGVMLVSGDLTVARKVYPYVGTEGSLILRESTLAVSNAPSWYVGHNNRTYGNITGSIDLSDALLKSDGTPDLLHLGALSVGAYGLGVGTLRLPPTLETLHVDGELDLGSTIIHSRYEPWSLLDLGVDPALHRIEVAGDVRIGKLHSVYGDGGSSVTGFPPRLEIAIGQPGDPADLYLGYTAHSWFDVTWRDLGRFDAWLNRLYIGVNEGSGQDGYAVDLSGTNTELSGSITTGRVALTELVLGDSGKGDGVLRLPSSVTNISVGTLQLGSAYYQDFDYSVIDLGEASRFRSLTVTNTLRMGRGRFTWSSGGVTNVGFPKGTSVTIGRSPSERGRLVLGHTWGANGTEVVFGPGVSRLRAYLTELTVGRASYQNRHVTTRLDLRGAALDVLDVEGSLRVGWASGGGAGAASGFVFLPEGECRVTNLVLATGENTEGHLWLSNTVLHVNGPVTIGDGGIASVTTMVHGVSAGLDLADTNLWVSGDGLLSLVFGGSLRDPWAPCWGMRVKGHAVEWLQGLMDSGLLVCDTSGLTASDRKRLGVYYDAQTDHTCVGLRRKIFEGTLISLLGRSGRSIVLNPTASGAIVDTARELAAQLKLSTSTGHTVRFGAYDGRGIYLTTADQDTTGLAPPQLSQMGPEGLYIRADSRGAAIIGNTELAVSEGVSVYLEHLGYRWFFPHEAWHIVPDTLDWGTDWTYLGEPSFANRRIWYGYGAKTAKTQADYDTWCRWNRMGGDFVPQCGHAYDGIIHRHETEFSAHPEYLALKPDGSRYGNKFCNTNVGLRALCLADALTLISDSVGSDSERQMVSMDPSDGPGNCHCPGCLQLGTAPTNYCTDRVVHLANHVAAGVRTVYPGKWVGMYAYSDHSMPPTIACETNLYVQVATAYNTTPYTVDELIEEWAKHVTAIGIRDYFDVVAWSWNQPGQAKGGRVADVRYAVPHYHANHATTLSAESSIGWLSHGLGHYVASKLCWDVSADVDALVDDFYNKCFPGAREPVETLFTQWQHYRHSWPIENDLAIWLDLANQAAGLAESPAETERINHIKHYLHFLCLFHAYREWPAGDWPQGRLDAYAELLRYANRITDLSIVSSYALARRLAGSDAPYPEYQWNSPDCVWKDDQSMVSDTELQTLFQADLAAYKPIDGLTITDWSDNFRRLNGGPETDHDTIRLRGGHQFVIELTGNPAETLSVSAGFIYDTVYELPVKIYRTDQDPDDRSEVPVYETTFTGDRAPHEISFGTLAPGFYRMTIDDRRSSMTIDPTGGFRLSILADTRHEVWTSTRNDCYFYVPPGTTRFAVITGGPMTVHKPDGTVLDWQDETGQHVVDVGPSDAGVWEITFQSGTFYFLGIPEFIGLAPQDMLTPAEVP